MLGFIAKRAFSSLVALFLFVTVMFFVAQIVIPTDFTTQFSWFMNREARERLAEELGIDRPLWEQYAKWLGLILRGSLGTSLYGPPVIDVLKRVLPYTLLIFLVGTLISFQLGLWLGKWVAWRGAGPLSGMATLSAIGLYTTFPPWLAFLLTYFVARRLDWLHSTFTGSAHGFSSPFAGMQGGARDFDPSVWDDSILSRETVMLYMVLTFLMLWFALILLNRVLKRTIRWQLPPTLELPLFVLLLLGSWYVLGFNRQALDVLSVAGVALLAYILLSFGDTMLIMRTSMMDTTKEDYIVTARAKGLPARTVRDKHAARNALLPVLSRLVVSLPYLVTGIVIIEIVLDWPGLSGTLFHSMYNEDMPVVMGALLLVGFFSAAARLVLDVVYAYLDPRIRYDSDVIRRVV